MIGFNAIHKPNVHTSMFKMPGFVSSGQFVALGQGFAADTIKRSYIDEVVQKEENREIHLHMNVNKAICGKETFD
jgi:hypothetical protein